MNTSDPQAAIRAAVSVTHQRVTIAKGLILRAIGGGSASAQMLLEHVIRSAGIVVPKEIIVHPSVDSSTAVRAVAEGFSWKIAAIEAICGLVGMGALIPEGGYWTFSASVGWTTVPPGGGSGSSSGFDFEEFSFSVPSNVRRALSLEQPKDQYLSDPDLYLGMLTIDNMHGDVAAALREAVKCFRLDLWLAAVAMLGKASEGAWIELGGALLRAGGVVSAPNFAKQRDVLDDVMAGPAKKMDAVLKIFDRQDIFGVISKESGVRPSDLRVAAQWSNTVRDSRNTLHFLAEAATPNNYDKVGVLLLGGADPLRTLYKLKATAETTT